MSFLDSDLRFLWFHCGSTRFSVPISHLREVMPLAQLFRPPMTEPSLAGFFSLRNQIIPVFNPLALVSTDAPVIQLPAIVIILTIHDQGVLGLLSDKIGKMVHSPMPKALNLSVRVPGSFLGMTTLEDGSDAFVVDVFGLAGTFGLTPVSSQTLATQSAL